MAAQVLYIVRTHHDVDDVDTGTFGPFYSNERAQDWAERKRDVWSDTSFIVERLCTPIA